MSSDTTCKLEFMVQMTCSSCENAVRKALENIEGVRKVDVDLASERVVVETVLPSSHVAGLIETTGRRAVLQGMGSLGAAVAMMEGCGAKGVTRLVQVGPDRCVIEGTLDGLEPGTHHLAVHELGDISRGCDSCGDIFGADVNNSQDKPVGDLGSVQADKSGRAEFRLEDPRLRVYDLIGRSMVIHSPSRQNHSEFTRLACGIIARSSGLFENSKRICACDGVVLWDERDKPLAGPGRQNTTAPSAQL